MGTLVAVQGCSLEWTVTGGSVVEGEIVTVPSLNSFVESKGIYYGDLTVIGVLSGNAPVNLIISPSGGVVKVNGESVVLKGDGSVTINWSGTTGSPPPSGTVSVKISDAGQSSLFVG